MKRVLLFMLIIYFYSSRGAWGQALNNSSQGNAVKVGMITRPYVDNKRLNWQGTGPRPLLTEIWYPAGNGGDEMVIKDSLQFSKPIAVYKDAAFAKKQRFPLVLISHGAHGNAAQMRWLAYVLASRGIIAAVVNHNGSAEEEKAIDGFTLTDFCMWERPKDLSAVLDHLLSDPVFGKKIDTTRVASAGFSLGGATAIWVAGAVFNRDSLAAREPAPPEQIMVIIRKQIALSKTDPVVIASIKRMNDPCYDPRFKAVFALAPAIGQAFSHDGLKRIKVPVQIVVGDADVIAPKQLNAEHYTAGITTARKLIVLPGERGHYTHPPLHSERYAELNEVAEIAGDFFRSVFQMN